MKKFLIVIEKEAGGYGAYSPDLPGCVATGRTRREVETRMRAAIRMHVAGLLEDGLPLPKARSAAAYFAVE